MQTDDSKSPQLVRGLGVVVGHRDCHRVNDRHGDFSRLRRKEPALLRPYRAWGYPWTQLIFGAAAFAMTANIWLVRPVRSSIGLAVMLLGIPFFYYWRRRAPAGLEKSTTVSASA